jgi:hypothetical protein
MLAPLDLSEQSASDFVALAIRTRAEDDVKKFCQTGCIGDLFLSWSENRTAVLTIIGVQRLGFGFNRRTGLERCRSKRQRRIEKNPTPNA